MQRSLNNKKFWAVVILAFIIFSGTVISNLKEINHARVRIGKSADEGKIDLRSGDQAKSWAINYKESGLPREDRCKKISLKDGSTNDLFVPFRTQPEWRAFLDNAPNNVIITECCAVFGDKFGDSTFCGGIGSVETSTIITTDTYETSSATARAYKTFLYHDIDEALLGDVDKSDKNCLIKTFA